MPTPSEITARHKARLDAVRSVLGRGVLTAFDRITQPSDVQVAEFTAAAVPLVLAAQTITVDLVDAYVSTIAGTATGTSTAPVGLDPDLLIGARARNGTYLETVYARPLWEWARKDGDPLALAAAARSRIGVDLLTDVALVQRDATWVRTQIDPRITRWRRVTSGESCDLCNAASTKTYGRINQMHLHPGCDCTVEPVVDPQSTGVPNPSDLTGTYRQLGDLRTSARVPGVAVHDHGELGPLLAVAGHAFTE